MTIARVRGLKVKVICQTNAVSPGGSERSVGALFAKLSNFMVFVFVT